MKSTLKNINSFLSEKYVDVFRYKPYIQTILLHKIYQNRDQVTYHNGTVSEGVDQYQFEEFVRFFAERKVKFIDADDILQNKLDPKSQYIFLTFDDGYYNNFWALDILSKYNAKATFYISTNHIKEEKSYWWDTLYREMSIQEKSKKEIYKVIGNLQQMKWQDQEKYISDNFGPEAMKPKNDIDRPMNEKELKKFAQHPTVRLGNHTHNHLNVTIYTKEELTASLKECTAYLESISDQKITSIAYPYGFHDDNSVQTSLDVNLALGITVIPGRNLVTTLDDQAIMRMKRTQLSGFFDIKSQCENMHTNFSLVSQIKKALG